LDLIPGPILYYQIINRQQRRSHILFFLPLSRIAAKPRKKDVACISGSNSGQFVPDFVFFEHGILVHTFVYIGDRQGGSSFAILDAKM
jgi:hypothetical protein